MNRELHMTKKYLIGVWKEYARTLSAITVEGGACKYARVSGFRH